MSAILPEIKKVQQLVIPLSNAFHKGQAGRIGIIGGSEDYTGAPYFSGITSMRVGADLCHIFCEPGAGTVIKSYSPDLIVHPYLRTKDSLEKNSTIEEVVNRVTDVFPRLHVLVVGPGLSRDSVMQETAKELIKKAREKNIPTVIDADGLYLIQHQPDLIQGYKKAILTPNIVEFKRLCERMNIDMEQKDKEQLAKQLSQSLGGVTIVQKGLIDYISNGEQVLKCKEEGGVKRMGGQGDILSGAIATFLAWGKAYEEGLWKHSNEIPLKDIPLFASWGGCYITRKSSELAFKKYGRSVLTSHVLEEIGLSYDYFMKLEN